MFIQGGKFDHADRLFQSIESTYRNCLSNTSDVKELTPEFFYMPEFLENLNSYHFGVKQDGEPLGGVGLPPWAKVMDNFCNFVDKLLVNLLNQSKYLKGFLLVKDTQDIVHTMEREFMTEGNMSHAGFT
jgi:hypothetical protein